MKRLIILLVALSMALLIMLVSCGKEDREENVEEAFSLDLAYTLSESGENYIVSGIGENKTGDVIIPNTYEGKPVTAIGEKAFEDCRLLKSVVIPSSVSSIGDDAFRECINLVSVQIAEGITSIGNGAFYGCTVLGSVNLPNSLTGLGYAAFFRCVNLSKIEIPDNISVIQENTFSGCYKLASVKIGTGLTEIRSLAFDNCYCLLEIENKSSHITVSNDDSNGGIGLNAINIGNNDSAFKTILSFNSDGYIVYINGSEKILMSYTGCERQFVVPEDITTIYKFAFYMSKSLMKVDIGNGVSKIGEYALYGCNNLLVLNVGSSLSKVGNKALYSCGKLIEIVNKSSILFDGNYARKDVISGASKYLKVYDEDVSNQYRVRLTDDGFIVFTDTRPNEFRTDGCVLMGYIGNETDIEIPEIVNSVHPSAFYGNQHIKSVKIGKNAVYLKAGAFAQCRNLEKVTIEVDENSMYYLVGPDLSVGRYAGLYYIGNNCFEGCAIKEIIIPKTVKRIEYKAFEGCDGIKVFCELRTNPKEYYGGYSDDMGCERSNVYWYSDGAPASSFGNRWHYEKKEIAIWE